MHKIEQEPDLRMQIVWIKKEEKNMQIYLVYIINLFIIATNLKFNIMETSLSEKESLDLIRQMISTAKNNLQQGMGNIFLLWGYLVAGISLGTFILLLVIPGEARYYAFFLWSLMALGVPVHYRLIRRLERNRDVTTYVEKIMAWVWIAFSGSIVTLIAGIILSAFFVIPLFTDVGTNHDAIIWFQWLFLPPAMLCLYGLALFVSGKAYGFRPLAAGGVICWVASLILLACLHLPRTQEIQQAMLCLCATAGFIIPGHLLNRKEQNHVPGP